MARPKLRSVKGRLVKEWRVSPSEFKTLIAAKPPKIEKIRIRTPRVTKSELRLTPSEFTKEHLLYPHRWWPHYFCKARYRVRKNQKNLTALEWQRFIHAIEALAETGISNPSYADFVQIHVNAMDTPAGHMWGAHGGANFLSWHREYLAKLEARLIAINPLVTLPYWDWVNDRSAIPAALSDPGALSDWGISRNPSFNGNSLASAAELNTLLAGNNFTVFQNTLEAAPFHNRLHVLVGGTMATSASPADPLFWLHHAFIDKIWADWQALHVGVNPPNPATVLKPAPIMTRTVSQVHNTRALGYIYA